MFIGYFLTVWWTSWIIYVNKWGRVLDNSVYFYFVCCQSINRSRFQEFHTYQKLSVKWSTLQTFWTIWKKWFELIRYTKRTGRRLRLKNQFSRMTRSFNCHHGVLHHLAVFVGGKQICNSFSTETIPLLDNKLIELLFTVFCFYLKLKSIGIVLDLLCNVSLISFKSLCSKLWRKLKLSRFDSIRNWSQWLFDQSPPSM